MSSSYDTASMVPAAASTRKAAIGAQIVTRTLDTLNRTAPGRGKGKYSAATSGMAASYDFQKSVLSAIYNPTGAIADLKS
jgi:hypothetical protein